MAKKIREVAFYTLAPLPEWDEQFFKLMHPHLKVFFTKYIHQQRHETMPGTHVILRLKHYISAN